MKCRVFPENVEELLLDANAEDEEVKMITTDRMTMPWKMSLLTSLLMTKTKGLFIWAETPRLPDPGLTSEVNFKHCNSLEYD